MHKIEGTIIDVVGRRQLGGRLVFDNGCIVRIEEEAGLTGPFIMPGFIDAHVHIESSMLTPAAFGRQAVRHGTVAVVADPHEIANVVGVAGIDFMIASSLEVPLKFFFGAPSCVPATPFERSGAVLTARDIETLLARHDIHFLAEMMNFPGVIGGDAEVMAKLAAARRAAKPVDGHAPGLTGKGLVAYVEAGIGTDHESTTLNECLEKLALGMKIQLRQGSSARNLEDLHPLITSHTNQCMLCTDDLKPADLAEGHINLLVKKALALGHDLFDVLQCACLNPVRHYNLNVGLLQPGDAADFIVVDDLEDFRVRATWIDGKEVSRHGSALFELPPVRPINQFQAASVTEESLRIKAAGSTMRVIEVTEGQIVTGAGTAPVTGQDGLAVADPSCDLLKIVVLNRYRQAPPALGFVRGFGLKEGAMASSIAHDSHNIIAVGVDDQDLARAINLLHECGGGLSFVVRAEEELCLELPVAGLMAVTDGRVVAARYHALERMAGKYGCRFTAPFMTMAFLALPVIPALKITDQGLFDVDRFAFTELFV